MTLLIEPWIHNIDYGRNLYVSTNIRKYIKKHGHLGGKKKTTYQKNKTRKKIKLLTIFLIGGVPIVYNFAPRRPCTKISCLLI